MGTHATSVTGTPGGFIPPHVSITISAAACAEAALMDLFRNEHPPCKKPLHSNGGMYVVRQKHTTTVDEWRCQVKNKMNRPVSQMTTTHLERKEKRP